MIEHIAKKIKFMLSWQTDVFSQEKVERQATLISDEVRIDGLNGEYVLTGSVHDVSTSAVVNNVLDFVGGVAKVNGFLGDDGQIVEVWASKIRVAECFSRDVAMEHIADKAYQNSIAVYLGSLAGLATGDKHTASEDGHYKGGYSIGVIYKVDAKQFESVAWDYYDSMYANAVVGAVDAHKGSTMVKFVRVLSRFMSGEYYCVEMEFAYKVQMSDDEEGVLRAEAFDAGFNLRVKE